MISQIYTWARDSAAATAHEAVCDLSKSPDQVRVC
jgi:hypothetical protein